MTDRTNSESVQPRTDYRAEAYGDFDGYVLPPWWVSVEAPDGTMRTAHDAIKLIESVVDFSDTTGSPYGERSACKVLLYVYPSDNPDDLYGPTRVSRTVEDAVPLAHVAFWEVTA